MARAKEFNRDKVLQSAIRVFRKQGYGVTTTEDLRLAMGIGRQSFYDSFRGKKEIYAEALSKYQSDQISKYLALVQSDGSPLKSIEKILMSIAQETSLEKQQACLGVSSICEFGTSADDISSANRGASTVFINLFRSLLSEAISRKEVRKNLNPLHTANFLLTILSGLKVASRGGANKVDLARTVHLALDGLKPF